MDVAVIDEMRETIRKRIIIAIIYDSNDAVDRANSESRNNVLEAFI
jgi:hypothetical protein